MKRICNEIQIFETKQRMARASALFVAERLRAAIARGGEAFLLAPAGGSQLELINYLVELDIDWSKVTLFHLDEYIGLPMTHKASFRRYLQEHLVSRVTLKKAWFIDGDAQDPAEVCRRVGEAIRAVTIDVAMVGIGENGHLAFNDPPADFLTDEPYITVTMDEACRRQQVGEGWFATLDDVPRQAISVSIREIMRARTIVCTVPDERKSEAVRNCLEGEIGPERPGSVLRLHPDCHYFMDAAAASKLTLLD